MRSETSESCTSTTSVRRATSALVQDAGAICLLASTHDQAVALAGGEPQLALAILDLQMPDGDVARLVKRLRASRAVLPVIGTSAADRCSDFFARGVTRFREKPWQLGDLVQPSLHRRPSKNPSMGADTLVGNDVSNHKDEHLGDIEEIMLDMRSGRVAYAVLTRKHKENRS